LIFSEWDRLQVERPLAVSGFAAGSSPSPIFGIAQTRPRSEAAIIRDAIVILNS